MNWYVAEAMFKSSIDDAGPGYVPLAERSWFLISAADEETAHSKAVEIAKSRPESFANSEGEQVRWKFVRIERVREIMDAELVDGTEIWSEIAREGPHEAPAT